MEVLQLFPNQPIEQLVQCAQISDEPVLVVSGEDECLVAMRPEVLERILVEGYALQLSGPRSYAW